MKPSLKSKLYQNYEGPKCSRTTYYERMKNGMSFEEAIKPICHEERYKVGSIKSRKFEKELEWYYKQKGEKTSRDRFYQRLYQGWPKEDAIKKILPKRGTGIININKNPYIKSRTPLLKKVDDSDKYEIRIRYSKEEANVIRKEYIKLIDDLEWKLHGIEDLQESKEITKRLDRLKKEYEIFQNSNSHLKFS